MPEGDTILWAATRMRPVLEGRVPDEIHTPQLRHRFDRWPERLGGRTVHRIGTHGKHLFVHFEGDLVLHSHLGMSGAWSIAGERRRWPGAWLLLRAGERWVAQLRGPRLELLTEGRTRFDRRLAALGPDILAGDFDAERFLVRLRSDDPTRGIGDALLDQHILAGIGNIWKSEGCWQAEIDPRRPVAEVSDEEAIRIVDGVRPRMLRSGLGGPRAAELQVYGKAGRPCPRCGNVLLARVGGAARSPSGLAMAEPAPHHPAGDDNRTTYWCSGCQR